MGIGRDHGLDDAHGTVGLLRLGRERQRILREARPAIARTGAQKGVADTRIEPDGTAEIVDIGADLIAQVGHFVDEGHLGGEETVGGVFDQLGGRLVGRDDRRVGLLQRGVEGPGERRRPVRRHSR